jgi:hypothetical protein
MQQLVLDRSGHRLLQASPANFDALETEITRLSISIRPGSGPDVGSSRNRTSGSLNRARAGDNWIYPAEASANPDQPAYTSGV